MLIHATTIDVAGQGVLIIGASGSGKSDLALRMIRDGAFLVSDDQTKVEVEGTRLMASAPRQIRGLIEVRGIGLLPAPSISRSWLRLVLNLSTSEIERVPEADFWVLPGRADLKIPMFEFHPFEASSTVKLRMALQAVLKA